MKIKAFLEECDKDTVKDEDQILKDLKAGPKKPDLKKGLKRESQADLDQADIDIDADGPIRRKDFPLRNRMDASALKAAIESCEDDDEMDRINGKEKEEDMTPEIGDKIGRPDLGKVGQRKEGKKKTENFDNVIEDAKKTLKRIHGRVYERPKTGFKHEARSDDIDTDQWDEMSGEFEEELLDLLADIEMAADAVSFSKNIFNLKADAAETAIKNLLRLIGEHIKKTA